MNKVILKNENSDKPYEKFIRLGPESLTEAELLAVILRTGTKNCSATELAQKILTLTQNYESGLNGLHHLSLSELKSIQGIGEVKAIKLKCIAELSVRMAKETAKEKLRFDSPDTVATYFMEELRHEEKEKILLLSLDNKLHLIEKYILSVGTVNATLLSPREVFVQALKCKASRIMLLHNHPSGDSSPSRQDIIITKKIKEAGILVEIPIIDHIIIGNGNYTSMNEKGLL